MVQQSKMTGRASSVPGGLARGTLVSMGITLAMAAVLAKLVQGQTLAWENIGYGIMGTLLAASFLGAKAAYGSIRRQRALVSLMSAGCYYALLLSLTALFFGGQYDGAGVTALLILGGSMAAALLGTDGRRGGDRRRSPGKLRKVVQKR